LQRRFLINDMWLHSELEVKIFAIKLQNRSNRTFRRYLIAVYD